MLSSEALVAGWQRDTPPVEAGILEVIFLRNYRLVERPVVWMLQLGLTTKGY